MKKIVIASDSFKGTLSSKEIGDTFLKVWKEKYDVINIPISDGGDGFIDAVSNSIKGKIKVINVEGPTRKKVDAKVFFVQNNECAIIEVAQTIGLHLIKEKEPFYSSSYGVGQLIDEVLKYGVKKIYIGLGGSCTNDGGAGMLEALGVEFRNYQNSTLIGMNNFQLDHIREIDLSNFNKKIKDVEIIIVSDVVSPLLGPKGAAYGFSKQKGADTIEKQNRIEKNLMSFSNITKTITKKDKTKSLGAGAAGGLGFGILSYFPKVKVELGIKLFLELIDFKEKVKNVNLIITGEGQMDQQTLQGKAPFGILQIANELKIDVIGICGICDDKENLQKFGFKKIYSIVDTHCLKQESYKNPKNCLKQLIKNINI